ncbi:conserved hypothetical protein [Ricinus communis]|uniref:Uncharacterized protein n=1 Tax=Ricinus communis TaxID=3988 RepID=B9RSN3_RICCO|nr:conserved hypothetical protein [Ricinus communis]
MQVRMDPWVDFTTWSTIMLDEAAFVLMESFMFQHWYFDDWMHKWKAGLNIRLVPFLLPHPRTVITPGSLVDVELKKARAAFYFEGAGSSKVSYIDFIASLPLRWISPDGEALAGGMPCLVEESRKRACGAGASSPTTPATLPSNMVVGDFVTPPLVPWQSVDQLY